MKATLRLAAAFGLALMAPAVCSAALYTVVDLGTLGGSQSEAYSINASGQVTGQSYIAGPIGSQPQRAFIYSGGAMSAVGTLGGKDSSAQFINNSGEIVGSSNLLGDTESHAFLYSAGTMTDLGFSGGPLGMNDNGQIVGTFKPPPGTYDHAFLLEGGVVQDLGTLGGPYSIAYEINNAGQAAGFAGHTDGYAHAFLYSNGVMNDLGTLGGNSFGAAINALGQVTGSVEVGDFDPEMPDVQRHAALFADGMISDLGTLGGNNSEGFGINASGHIVGYSEAVANQIARHAIIYRDGTMYDLNSLVDPLFGWQLEIAYGINDNGQIAGKGKIGGATHAFLLNPVPEPSTLALAAFGFAALAAWRSRRRNRA